jgi:hypothetical protein
VEGVKLRLHDVTRLDQRELQERFGDDVLSFDTPSAGEGGEHGELATATAILILGMGTLRLLAAWLLQARRTQQINETIEIERPDGTRVKRSLSVDLSEVDEAEPAVLKALVDLFPLDLAQPDGGE